jgi:hypothetical protein
MIATGPSLRRDRRAFSAFYGAFAVLLAATLVFGAIAASGPAHDARPSPTEASLPDRFLDTLLSSTDHASNATFAVAMTRMCTQEPCAPGTHARELLARMGNLATHLARPLGAEFLLALSAGALPELRQGSLEPRPGLALSRAEVFHPPSGGFVSLGLFLDL